MDRKILNTFFAVMLLGLFSCEKDANIPLPQEDPKLVVYSYISPEDTLVLVSVTSSNPVFNSSANQLFRPIENATVTLNTLGTDYSLTFDSFLNCYKISTTVVGIHPGQHYALTVSAPGYTTVSAQTTVPSLSDFQFNATFVSENPPENSGPDHRPARFTFDVNWKHYHDEDYYRIQPVFYYVDSLAGMPSDTLLDYHNDHFYSSENASGGTISDQIETGSAIHEEPFPYPHGFYYTLIISTYDYFKFHESVNDYEPDNPFAEPTLVYSHMDNGYGIFAGYLRVRKRIDL
jgi:hypothetical protein